MLARALVLGPLAAFAAVWIGCSSAPSPTPGHEGEGPAGEPTATTSEAITSSDAVSRAQQWVTAKLLYCQSPNGKPDGDTACSSVCQRQSNPQWDPYRSDCSGFVSWAWGIAPPGHVTSTFAPFDTSVSNTIQAADLMPGDACNRNSGGHIVLFEKWVTPGKTALFMEEPGCSSNPDYAHEFQSDVTISGVNINIAYHSNEAFTAIRFNQMTESPPDAGAPEGGSSSGGGSGSSSGSGGSSGSGSGGGSTSSGGSSGSSSSGGSGSGGGSSGSTSSGSSGSTSSSGSGGSGSTSSGGSGAGSSSGPAGNDAGSGGNGAGNDPRWNGGGGSAGCSVSTSPAEQGLGSSALVAVGLAFLRRRARQRRG